MMKYRQDTDTGEDVWMRLHQALLVICAATVFALAFFFVFVFAALPAQAQPAPPPCFPLVNGYPVGAPKVIKTEVGTHLFWFCGDVRRTKVDVAGLSCEAGQCSEAAWAAAVSAVTRASAKVGTARALWAESVTVDCKTDTRPLCVERSSLIEQNRAAWRAEVIGWVQP